MKTVKKLLICLGVALVAGVAGVKEMIKALIIKQKENNGGN